MLVLAITKVGAESGESFEDRADNSTACHWIYNQTCPDPEIRFYLYTRSNPDERQLINTGESSNISSSFFNPQKPSKIIIHGFRADMFLTPLFRMKTGKMKKVVSKR
jgi:pancreatic lipase-related protein 2